MEASSQAEDYERRLQTLAAVEQLSNRMSVWISEMTKDEFKNKPIPHSTPQVLLPPSESDFVGIDQKLESAVRLGNILMKIPNHWEAEAPTTNENNNSRRRKLKRADLAKKVPFKHLRLIMQEVDWVLRIHHFSSVFCDCAEEFNQLKHYVDEVLLAGEEKGWSHTNLDGTMELKNICLLGRRIQAWKNFLKCGPIKLLEKDEWVREYSRIENGIDQELETTEEFQHGRLFALLHVCARIGEHLNEMEKSGQFPTLKPETVETFKLFRNTLYHGAELQMHHCNKLLQSELTSEVLLEIDKFITKVVAIQKLGKIEPDLSELVVSDTFTNWARSLPSRKGKAKWSIEESCSNLKYSLEWLRKLTYHFHPQKPGTRVNITGGMSREVHRRSQSIEKFKPLFSGEHMFVYAIRYLMSMFRESIDALKIEGQPYSQESLDGLAKLRQTANKIAHNEVPVGDTKYSWIFEDLLFGFEIHGSEICGACRKIITNLPGGTAAKNLSCECPSQGKKSSSGESIIKQSSSILNMIQHYSGDPVDPPVTLFQTGLSGDPEKKYLIGLLSFFETMQREHQQYHKRKRDEDNSPVGSSKRSCN